VGAIVSSAAFGLSTLLQGLSFSDQLNELFPITASIRAPASLRHFDYRIQIGLTFVRRVPQDHSERRRRSSEAKVRRRVVE
jgi:hypothetical protein